MAVFLLYVTYPSKKSAVSIVDTLLTKKLIACATLLPVDSRFVWKGKRQDAKEWVSFIKTSKPAAAKKEIEKLHPYDVPCILSVKVGANASFAAWTRASVK